MYTIAHGPTIVTITSCKFSETLHRTNVIIHEVDNLSPHHGSSRGACCRSRAAKFQVYTMKLGRRKGHPPYHGGGPGNGPSTQQLRWSKKRPPLSASRPSQMRGKQCRTIGRALIVNCIAAQQITRCCVEGQRERKASRVVGPHGPAIFACRRIVHGAHLASHHVGASITLHGVCAWLPLRHLPTCSTLYRVPCRSSRSPTAGRLKREQARYVFVCPLATVLRFAICGRAASTGTSRRSWCCARARHWPIL